METELAMEYLQRESVRNISMIEPLRLGRASVTARTEKGVLLQMMDIIMVAADSVKDALELLDGKPDFRTLNVMGGPLSDGLMEKLGLKEECRCWQAVYLKNTPLPVDADVRQLDLDYFDAVLEGYSLFHDPDYIQDRLEAGVVFGAFVDGNLAGFIGEHDEGSMGMLEVFPAYRRRGLAVALESYQINRYLSEGRVPFDQVIVGNEKSLGLQKKLGMAVSEDTMSWMHRKAMDN